MFYKWFAGLFLISTALSGGALLAGRAQPHSILAFVSMRTGREQVYLLDVDRRITYLISRNDYASSYPVWSSSGDLAYVRQRVEGRDVIIYNPFTGKSCAISGRLLDEAAPAWSPSGDLAYIIGRNSLHDVYVQAGCDGRTARNVTRGGNHGANSPQWSSAGQLAYSDEVLGGRVIALLDPITGESTIIRQRMGLDASPVWFGDRLLAFVALYENQDGSPNREIMVYDTETQQFRNISNHPGDDNQPAWSPDGRLAFLSNRDGNNEIYLFDFATNTLTNISHSPTDDIMPAWSPDGRLAYTSASGSVYDIVILDQIPGGIPRIVVNHPSQDYNPVWMP